MDFNRFVTENATAIFSLLGVIVGAVIVGIFGLVSQAYQRRWNIDLQRREWMRQRRERQLGELVAWLNQWLRTAARVRRLEEILLEAKFSIKKLAKLDVKKIDPNLESYGDLLRDLNATSPPLVYALNDEDLIELYENFMDLISGYQDVFRSKNLSATVESNNEIISKAKDLIVDMQIRSDEILEDIYKAK